MALTRFILARDLLSAAAATISITEKLSFQYRRLPSCRAIRRSCFQAAMQAGSEAKLVSAEGTIKIA
jgi:hypothetical protein